MSPVALQALLLLMLFFEPPGPLIDGRLKSVSDGIREHNGIALAILACIVASLRRAMHLAPWPAYAFVWAALAGFLGLIIHPNTEGEALAHGFYAFLALCSLLVINTLLWYQLCTFLLSVALGWLALLLLCVFHFQGREDLIGPIELAIVLSVWWVWAWM
jgi:hypothetical protein